MGCIVTYNGKELDVNDFKALLLDGEFERLRKEGKLEMPESERVFGGDNFGNKPPIEPSVNDIEGNDKNPQRKFTQQMLRDEELTPEAKKEIAKTLNYVRQTNEMSIKEANDIIDKIGVDEAQNLVMNDGDLKPVVRVTMGQILIRKFNELAKDSKDEETKNYNLDKAIQTATFVTEKLATEPGQMIQAFSMWSRLTPEGQLRAANEDMARQAKEKLRRREGDINVIGDKFKKANEETVDELTKPEKIKEQVKKTESNRVQKAKDKIQKAKDKRAAIIKKYKNDKGKSLYSSPTGLTTEGIEFVGDLIKTYLDEGVAKLEIIADKVLTHLKEVGGKDLSDGVKKHVNDLVRAAFDENANKRISSNLADLEKEVTKIVKEHYTVTDEAKKNLVDKFVEKAGFEKDEAQQLAKEIETEFDKIATRKKRNILYNEKARFDKIQKSLLNGEKKEAKTVQDELIKYSNLGAFESKDFVDLMAKKFGIGELTKEQAAKLYELAKKVENAAEGSPKNAATEDLLAYRANLRGNDLMETAQGVWYANVLSGYKTHEKNVISTFFNSMGELGAEMMKDPKAIPYILGGYIKGVSKRGFVEAKHTVMTGRSPIHIKKIETPNVLERKNFVGGAINPANWFKYVMRLMVAEDVLSFQGLKEARAYQLARREAAKMGVNTWSKAGWDKVNEILLHTKERYDDAKATAKEEGLMPNGNITTEARRRIYELMEESRPIKMTEDAYGFAAHGTFNHESEGSLGALTNAIAGAVDSVNIGGAKPLRFVVPFTRIITNVVNNSLDFTPVGLIRAARGVRGFRSFEGNQFTKGAFKELSKEERQRLIAKASLGITLAATFQALHAAGIIQVTGAGTGNSQKDAQLRQEGWQEYSIKVGDKYYSYKYTPLVFMLGYLGNMNDTEKYGDDDKKTFLKKVEIATSRIGGQVVDMTWINSASTFLGTLAEPNPDKQARGVSNFLSGTARGFVPFSGAVTQGTQLTEQVFQMPQKQVNGAWGGLIQDIPIARNALNDKINALGDPIVRGENSYPFLSDFVSKEKSDPVWKYLLEKQGWVAPVNKNTIIVYDEKTNSDRPITNDEYFNFSKVRGQKIKNAINGILEHGAYVNEDNAVVEKTAEKLTPKQFNQVLTEIEKKATKDTKEELFSPIPKNQTTRKINTIVNKLNSRQF